MMNIYIDKLKAIFPYLKLKYHINTLEVFGSYVRGEEHPDSDLDLLITFDQTPTLFKFIELENHIKDELGIKIDLVMKDSLRPAIGEQILSEALQI